MEIFWTENLNTDSDYSAPIKPIKSNPSELFELISAIEIKWPSGSSIIACLPNDSNVGSLKNSTFLSLKLFATDSKSLTIKPTRTPEFFVLVLFLDGCNATTVPLEKNSTHSGEIFFTGNSSTSR